MIDWQNNFGFVDVSTLLVYFIDIASTSTIVKWMLFISFLTMAFAAGNSILFEYVNSTVLSDKLASVRNKLKSSTSYKRLLAWTTTNLSPNDVRLARQHQQHQASRLGKSNHFRRCMTSIGRFSLKSETERNPNIVTFFVALSNKNGQKPLSVDEFSQLWRRRVMSKHQRFRSYICPTDDRFFEVMGAKENMMNRYVTDVPHPETHDEFLSRIHEFCTTTMDVSQHLWEVQLSTGAIGSSGAIIQQKEDAIIMSDSNGKDLVSSGNCKVGDSETVALFRVHHALCDGVSLSVAVGDSCDEHDQLHNLMMSEYHRHCKKMKIKSMTHKILAFVKLFAYYVIGGIIASSLQFWRLIVGVNPFDEVIKLSPSSQKSSRSTTWKYVAPIGEAKEVTKNISRSATLNDLFVCCATSALKRQLEVHKASLMMKAENNKKKTELYIPSHLNITVPVHLYGGVLLPGQSLGNKIGAFVSAIPIKEGKKKKKSGDGNSSVAKRLKTISSILKIEGKYIPAYLIAWTMARMSSTYAPLWVSKFFLRYGSAKSVAVISNCKGFPFTTHWKGRKIEFLSAFLPLPPGIPIGFVLQSYNDDLSFTIEADSRAIPNANEFADWVVEEYLLLKAESEKA